MFRIHDSLVWIQIRIRGSMPLTNGSGFGSGSCYFRHWPSRRQQKTNLKKKFFCLLTFWRYRTFTSCFKDKKSKRSHKTVESRFLLIFLLHYRRIRIREAQKHVDPVDPDPGHWKRQCLERLGYRKVPHSASYELITFAADPPNRIRILWVRFLGFFKHKGLFPVPYVTEIS